MPTIRRTTPDIHIGTTTPRPTAEPASVQFRDALGTGAMTVLSGIEQAAGLVPGGGVVAAAVRAGASAAGGSTAASPGTTGAPAGTSGALGAQTGAQAGPEALLNNQTNQAMELLEMQQQISMEQRKFQTVSNVMKARHDTAKAVIQNVR